MTKWFTHFSQELAQGRQGPQDALHAYMDILHFLASDGKMLPHVLATPDAIKFATVTWLEADVDVLPAYPSTAIAVAQLLEHAPTPIITHISSSDVDVPAVARRLVHPLRVALAASPPPSREFFEAYVWLLHGFACAPLDVVAPFLPALLSAGAVRCVARALVRFSRHDVHKDAPDGIIDHGFRILYQLLQMGTGIPWVAQSVRHGLLDALVNIAPRLHIYGKGLQETCLALVKKLLPRYFLFRPVIRAVGRALERLEDDPNIALVQSRAFADSWAYLKDFAEHCVMFRTSWPLRECGNCAEQGHRSIFRRCARCREQHYCSVACQAAHWEKEHKEHCVRWLVPSSSAALSASTSSRPTSFGFGITQSHSRRQSLPSGSPPIHRPREIST
ncbi:hypothetical protein FA95DRAFT_1402505 [Auriscalpium vulgare]|uniref:Uncharacterized protein n=1 Tax=Auriscalpium vulgare TaxID=40419 RepID=A0ACB8RRT3_9AGAM|nr:hypothetical protein FA95DRAFT_1402505 [Auriscalpium vulgare]